jgi:hypothetical protein
LGLWLSIFIQHKCSNCAGNHIELSYIYQVSVILNEKLQCESHKNYGRPASVKWLQIVRKQTNTGISTALTTGTLWSTRTWFRARWRLVTST